MEHLEVKGSKVQTFIPDTQEVSNQRTEIVTDIANHRDIMQDRRNNLYNQLQELQERIDIIRNTISQIDTHLNDVPVDTPVRMSPATFDRHYS